MIASGGDWVPSDEPDWRPPVEWLIATAGARPSAVELATMSVYWSALFATVDRIKAEAEAAAQRQQG